MNEGERPVVERLADRLDRLLAGGDEPDAQLDDDLRDLDLLARRVVAQRPPPLGEADRAAIRLRLTSPTSRHAMVTRPLPVQSPRWPFIHLPVAAALAALVLLVALATAAVQASAASMPGEPLYGVKLARERAAITLAPTDAARANAYADQAADRLAEADRLDGRAGPAQVSTLTGEAQRSLDRARQAAGGEGAGPDASLQRRLQALDAQRQELEAAQERAAPAQASAASATPSSTGEPATPTSAPLVAAPAPSPRIAQPTAGKPSTPEALARAFATLPQPTPTTPPPTATSAPSPMPTPSTRASPSPSFASSPALEDVRAPTARAAVEGFYAALDDALAGDPGGFARAYSYLSDAARARTSYADFVARYRVDTSIVARWPSQGERYDEARGVVIDVVEVRGSGRVAEMVAWTVVDTPRGWRLDRSDTQAVRAPAVPPATSTPTARPGPARGRGDQGAQGEQGQQGNRGQQSDRSRPSASPGATPLASPSPARGQGDAPGQRRGSGRGSDESSSD